MEILILLISSFTVIANHWNLEWSIFTYFLNKKNATDYNIAAPVQKDTDSFAKDVLVENSQQWIPAHYI